MSLDVPSLIAALLERHLLDAPAEAALPELALTRTTAADLVAELVRRRWLTHFQAELLLSGRAAELVIGQYILLERLGQGGMGTVYKARHRVLKAVRAVKIIQPERLTGPNAVKRFFQEVEAVGKLFHPNIILPHDAGESNGAYFLAMEYVPGADLGRLLDRNGPLPAADAAEYIRQGALALQHAHERGLVHRDIKPANLLVSSADGRVKLLDLGLARVRALEEEGIGPQTALTQAGAVMGTPDYMAPEQAVDSHGVDIRADIYALACTLYHILAGQPPFPGGSVMEKLIAHRSREAKPLEQLRADLPSGLATVVRKAMAKSPESRYQTPAELASALAPYCSAANPAKPRPAGASGEHPIFPIGTRASIATIPGKSGVSRVPTPPGNPTMKAPAGAMPAAPSARTVQSLDTRLDPRNRPQEPAERHAGGQRRTRWPAVVAMIVVGALVASGARYFQRPAPDGGKPSQPQLAGGEEQTPVTVARTPPSDKGSPAPEPPAQPMRPGLARRGDGLVADAALARTGRGPGEKAVIRPVSFAQREVLRRLDNEAVRHVAFSAEGRRVVVVTESKLDIYDLGSLPEKAGRHGPLEPERGISSLDDLLSGLSEPTRAPTAVTVSADGKHAYLATTAPESGQGGGPSKGSLWNMVVHWENGQTPEILSGPRASDHKSDYRCVTVSPEGVILAAGTLSTASWWNGAIKPPRLTEFKHEVTGPVMAIAFSPDGKRALFCGSGEDLRLHTFGQAAPATPVPLRGHAKGARCAAFSADGRFAVTGGTDGTVCVWDFTGPPPADGILRPARELNWHQGPVRSVAFAPSGDRFLSGGQDGYFCLGEVSRSDRIQRVRCESSPAPVLGVAFSADGAYALYATERSLGRFLFRLPLAEVRSAGSGANPAGKPFILR
jgi:serine/threonine protein kinase